MAASLRCQCPNEDVHVELRMVCDVINFVTTRRRMHRGQVYINFLLSWVYIRVNP